MKYKIIVNEYRNEYGEVTESYYTVQIQRKFLFFQYWSTITHAFDDTYSVETTFNDLLAASEFVAKLKKGKVVMDEI
jgi:hypothetical protein